MTSPQNFKPNWLQWPINREVKTFRVYVVEPRKYSPADHPNIFNAALNLFIRSDSNAVSPSNPIEQFDLITFPEAFLPSNTLLETLEYLPPYLESFGCVHVGLRPSTSEDTHLFSTAEIKSLVQSLRSNEDIDHSDLQYVSEWIESQGDEGPYNIGCLFTIDSNQKIRICLHPKLVRSKFEISSLPEHHMKEANLLSLVTLKPKNKKFLSITIQPLICSDTLFLDTDRPVPRPLEAVNSDADCFGDSPPDHIDIVSVVTCTPQQVIGSPEEPLTRQWHYKFRESFTRVLTDPAFTRNCFSIFVLANFEFLSNGLAGGLSGTFIPFGLQREYPQPFINVSSYGTDNGEPKWSQPLKTVELPAKWKDRGYIAYLIPSEDEKHIARMLYFTIDRLPRQCAKWQENGLSRVQKQNATVVSGEVKFNGES